MQARLAVAIFVAAAFAVASVVRTVLVVASRRRWPRVASAIDRWWAWTPLVAAALALLWLNVVIGLLAIGVIAVVMTRPGALGSPFRPRPKR